MTDAKHQTGEGKCNRKKTRTERKVNCFHCGAKGHYIAQYPRKMARMAVGISEIQGLKETDLD